MKRIHITEEDMRRGSYAATQRVNNSNAEVISDCNAAMAIVINDCASRVTITAPQPKQADLAKAVSEAVRTNFPCAIGGPNTTVSLQTDEAGNKSLVAHNIAKGWSVIIHADGEVYSAIPDPQTVLSIMYRAVVNHVAPGSIMLPESVGEVGGSHGTAAQAAANSSSSTAELEAGLELKEDSNVPVESAFAQPTPNAPRELDGETPPEPTDFS